MSQHTPGPWEVIESKDVYSAVIAPGNATICMDVESPGNARLIAAGPDLLAACEAALDHIDPDTRDGDRAIDLVRAAIAKATGGT